MSRYKRSYAIIVAAGKGSRMNSETPKQLMPYAGATILETSIRRFYEHTAIDGIIVVSPQDGSLDDIYDDIFSRITGEDRSDSCAESEGGSFPSNSDSCAESEGGSPSKRIYGCNGGTERYESVCEGLLVAQGLAAEEEIDPSEVLVLIHDAARPGVDADIIDRNILAMNDCDAVVTAIPSVDSVRFVGDGADFDKKYTNIAGASLKDPLVYPIMKSSVVERKFVYNVQTPQTFRLSDIVEAYDKALDAGYLPTDDASVAEFAGINVAIVEGSRANNKITTQEDIPMTVRVGTGYDVHKLVPDRDLILCGTPVPYELGLLGHSDADVATHALMDALLGAAGMGDIGRHFPDTDMKYKGADSLELLAEVRAMLKDYKINNVDITIIAQAPKLAPYNKQMTENIARVLGVAEDAVNVKATTTEGLGFTGNKEGIAAIASCAIEGGF